MSSHAEYYPDGGSALQATPTGPYQPATRAEITALQASVAPVDALSDTNVASPALWNDDGALKVGTGA